MPPSSLAHMLLQWRGGAPQQAAAGGQTNLKALQILTKQQSLVGEKSATEYNRQILSEGNTDKR